MDPSHPQPHGQESLPGLPSTTQLPAGATGAPAISQGTSPVPNPPPAPAPSPAGPNPIVIALKDALSVLRQLLPEPTTRIATAYHGVGHARARNAGMIICLLASILFVHATPSLALGISSAYSADVRVKGNFNGIDVDYGARVRDAEQLIRSEFRLEHFVKSVASVLAIHGLLALACFGVRRMARSQGPFGMDIYIAGIAVLPLAIIALILNMLSAGTLGPLVATGVFGSAFTIVMLFAGMTRVYGMSERVAFICIPTVLCVTAYLTTTFFPFMAAFVLSR